MGCPSFTGSVQVFACAQDQYTLFLNGREILTGADSYAVQSGSFPIVKGDVLAAIVQDTGGGRAWLSLRVVRDGTTLLDAGDMLYQTTEQPSWKMSKLLSGFREPAVRTHHKRMGTDPRTRAYVQRRTAQGLSKPEIMRCLKRYVAREVFQAIRNLGLQQHQSNPEQAAA